MEMKRGIRNNGLIIVLVLMFAVSFVGQALAGIRSYNADRQSHGEAPVTLGAYLTSGHFVEATFENWESEFLQMAALVLLTAMLRQKGAPDSKSLEGEDPVDADPRESRGNADAPWPVKRGGLVLAAYEHSLSIALGLLFAASFLLHAAGGAREFSEEQRSHGEPAVGMLAYMGTSRFWFESFQNWQSEFLSTAVLIILAIFLRERHSPESKPVGAPHAKTKAE
jgi:glycerol uptake facilitator-like aquaporin